MTTHHYLRLRRPVDMILSLAALIVLSPVLLITALLIKTDGGPVFFHQARVGQAGDIFHVLKFRTMIVDADRYLDAKGMPTRSRITKIGGPLRRLSIDELPQFFNILIGDMGLIGPRPILPRMLPFLNTAERERLLVRPGVTGWAQVSGRNMIPWSKRFQLDVAYVQQASLRFDARIVWRTILTLVRPGDVSHDRNADIVDDITIRPLPTHIK